MVSPRVSAKAFFVAALLSVVLLAMACAKAEEKVAAPAPSTPSPAPAATPAPAAAPAPAPSPAPAAAPAPAPTPAPAPVPAAALKDGPLVPGGPPFYADKIAQYKGWQILEKYHHTKLPLWTKAKYGGQHITFGYFLGPRTFRMYEVQSLNRPSIAGMLLYTDFGRCSMVGRDADFSVCKGEYASNNGFRLVPGIFQRWEQPNPVTYVFHVRKGVLWPATPPMARSDREMTAEDIVFFLEVTKKGGITKQNFALVKDFQAIDRYTVQINMNAPNADFLLNLAHTSQGVFPRECFEEKGCLGEFKSVSPGPFLVKEHVLNQKLVFEKNPEFYLKGLPYVDRIVLLTLIDPTALQAAFLTGQTDIALPGNLEQAEALVKRVPGSQLQTSGGTGGVPGIIRTAFQGPLADVRVRRAMVMTMDHPTMWEASNGGFHLLSTLVSRHYFGDGFYLAFEQAGENYVYSPERAKKLLAEAGYPDGFSTRFASTFISPYVNGMMLHLQTQWKKHLGIDLKLVTTEFISITNQFYEGKWEGFLDGTCCWIPGCWGTADDTFSMFVQGSPLNVQKINDPVIEDFHRRQRGELDPVKRVKLLWEFDQYEASQVYFPRVGFCSNYNPMQPWELNGANHDTMYFGGLNGPTWLAMHDTSKYPGGRR